MVTKLAHSLSEFGETRIDRLDPASIKAWRRAQSERDAWARSKCFMQVLNFGVRLGTASWGTLLAQAWGTLLTFNPNIGVGGVGTAYSTSTLLKAAPSVALFLTVLCLALIGDGLRSALDPRGEQR